jgi:uncharacterized membrane protein YjgN (DUF898 family)
MRNFYTWLANSPVASALKVGVAAALGWFVANPNVLNVHPALAIAITAALPVLINWMNPDDLRYGNMGELD